MANAATYIVAVAGRRPLMVQVRAMTPSEMGRLLVAWRRLQERSDDSVTALADVHRRAASDALFLSIYRDGWVVAGVTTLGVLRALAPAVTSRELRLPGGDLDDEPRILALMGRFGGFDGLLEAAGQMREAVETETAKGGPGGPPLSVN